MNSYQLLRHLIIVLAILSILFISCKKEKDDFSGDNSFLRQNAAMDIAFSEIPSIADEAYSGSLNSFRNFSGQRVYSACAVISFDTLSAVKKFTIDFGPGCTGLDGLTRKGKINVEFTGNYQDSASIHTINLLNYYIGNEQFSGSVKVTRKGMNPSGFPESQVIITGTLYPGIENGGGSYTFLSTRARTWIEGYNTAAWNDDVYSLGGYATGTNRNETTYTLNTYRPLILETGYRHYTGGIIDHAPTGDHIRRVDYGFIEGGRDFYARVTVYGEYFNITLN